jgi:glycosyltransferase involved in cell wall biosynthesis
LISLARRAAHEALLARLRLEALLASWRGRHQPPRVMATACWTFPIYSQTFVHQEVAALAAGGFCVRFLYAQRGPRSALADACSALWPLKRRVLLHVETGASDLAAFRRTHPAAVEALISDIARASGLSRADVQSHEHFLQAFSFARAVRAWRADYLHSYFFYEQSLFALVASRLLGVPRGISCYADHMLSDYPLKVVKLHLQHSDVLVATSRRIAAELLTIEPVALPAVLTKANAIDTASFARHPGGVRDGDRTLRLLCVCRIDPKKGIEYLLSAVRLLLDRGLPVQLRIVGAPDAHCAAAQAYSRSLAAQGVRDGLDHAVGFVGQRSHAEIRGELMRASVFIAPYVDLANGDKDGIPTAVLEAMASACAIVATNAGSLSEVIDDGEQGLMVPQRDALALADALHRLADDAALAERLGAGALERVRREYDIAKTEIRLHERIREAIAARRLATVATGTPR